MSTPVVAGCAGVADGPGAVDVGCIPGELFDGTEVATGTTSLDEEDSAPLPAPFIALTVKV
ncbi:hypothetical protein D3C74_474630 [compost metagenome]